MGFVASPLSQKGETSHAELPLPPGNVGVQLGAACLLQARPYYYLQGFHCAPCFLQAFEVSTLDMRLRILWSWIYVPVWDTHKLWVPVSNATERICCCTVARSSEVSDSSSGFQPSPRPLVLKIIWGVGGKGAGKWGGNEILPANKDSLPPLGPLRCMTASRACASSSPCLFSCWPASWNILPNALHAFKTQIKSHPLNKPQGSRIQLTTWSWLPAPPPAAVKFGASPFCAPV